MSDSKGSPKEHPRGYEAFELGTDVPRGGRHSLQGPRSKVLGLIRGQTLAGKKGVLVQEADPMFPLAAVPSSGMDRLQKAGSTMSTNPVIPDCHIIASLMHSFINQINKH